ncbi:MAG: hypothetical protein R2788_00680 [Saprospiraceae bacterium]
MAQTTSPLIGKNQGKGKGVRLANYRTWHITATLSNETADLDIIILDACSESNCLAQGLTSVSVPNASAGMYFIVVDGYNGVGAILLCLSIVAATVLQQV